MQQLRHARLRLDGESGMSLLEVIIAMFVLAVSILGLASVASASLVQVRVSRDRQAATDVATSTLELMRLGDFATVAMLDSDGDGVPDSGATCTGAAEPFVTTSDGTPGRYVEHERTGQGAGGNITVTTTVTWYDDPTVDSDSDGDGDEDCSATPKDTKRVTVTAAWSDGGTTRSVVEETLVSPADRGLPLPSFRVGNDAVDLHFEKAEVYGPSGDTTGDGVEQCIPHTLRNVGAPDRYELQITRTDGATDAADDPFDGPLAAGTYDFSNAGYGNGQGKWFVRAEVDYPTVDVETPVDDRHSFNQPGSVPKRAKSDDSIQIATGDQATLRVCYRPTSTVELTQTFEFRVTVYSRFDDNVAKTIDHTITTGSAATKWFLYDTDDTQDHARTSGVTYPMGPEQSAQPDRLGTSSILPDYDTNVGDGHPGLEIRRGDTVARWHEQLTKATTFADTMDLVLWVSNDDALDGDLVPPAAQRLLVDLRVLKANESNVVDTWVSGVPVEWEQTERVGDTVDGVAVDGWQEVRVTLNLVSGNGLPLEVAKNQFLALTLTCPSTATDDCELAYDHVSYPSRLEVVTTS